MNGESLWQCRECEWEGPRSEVYAFHDPGSYPGPFAGALLHHCPLCGMQADDTGRVVYADREITMEQGVKR